MEIEGIEPQDQDCLLIIDIQNDFCAGGSLAVPDGDAIIPVVNRLSERYAHSVITQDWHPADHSSFASQHPGSAPFETTTMHYGEQTLWPDHCVMGSHGADFHPDLDTHRAQMVIRKGFRQAIDSYSAFFENDHSTPTGLTRYLQERGLKRVVCVGLALDYCVRFSALDALKQGFAVMVIEPACRGIDLDGSNEAARKAMREAGVDIIA